MARCGKDGIHPAHLWDFALCLRFASRKGLTHLLEVLCACGVAFSLQYETQVIWTGLRLLSSLNKRGETFHFSQQHTRSPYTAQKLNLPRLQQVKLLMRQIHCSARCNVGTLTDWWLCARGLHSWSPSRRWLGLNHQRRMEANAFIDLSHVLLA